MSADKRSVHTDALQTLGTLELDDTAARDAIHLAVEPVVSDETLYAGMHIGIVDGKASSKAQRKLGIVDPFVVVPINPGMKFWLVVYPRTITSLRHVWEHPDFSEKMDNPTKSIESKFDRSQQWLQNYAGELDVSYEELMSVADSHQGGGYGDYIVQGGRFEGETTPDEFWDHYAVVRNNPNPNRSSFFSCSC